jgi:hypothetical protein
LETAVITIILLLALALIGFARATVTLWFELRELKAVHRETCQKLETAQCKNKCKYLDVEKILEAEFLEDK